MHQGAATVLCDGDDGLARLQREVLPGGTVVLDWWQAAVRREHVAELLGHPERNAAALAHYAARRRRGEPIATSFVESAGGEIIARRMAKAQQTRSSRATVPPFLAMRTAVLNDTLERTFRRRHHGFRPPNDEATPAAAA